tara:strand:+ start:375 stop:926 length:552 start_codon:yes stop_codon:yes gene_type:complete
MFVTPGPNNAMLTASGMKFGIKRTLPHLIGIPSGHVVQVILVCYGLGNLFLKFPLIQFYMKILCAIYLIYLAWKIIGSFSIINKNTSGRPLKFYEAALFQIVNPKAWTIAIGGVSGFFPTEETLFVGTMFVAVTTALIAPSISIWMFFGNSLKLYLKKNKTKKIVEFSLALLLVLTAIFIIIK